MATLQAQAAGDKQLWILEASDCRLPAYVQPFVTQRGKEVWAVWPAKNLFHPANQRFYELLSVRSIGRAEKMVFLDDFDVLQTMMKKAEGVTPDYYYEWNGQKGHSEEISPAEIEPNDFPTGLDDHFLREVVSRTQVVELPALKIIWAAIVQVALQWLITYRRPINMGFCTMFALPYRTNWKSILMGAFPHAYQCFSRPKCKQAEALEEMGIRRSFRWVQLLSVRKKGHLCNWKLEVIPNEVWDEATTNVDRKKKRAGEAVYSKYIAKAMDKQRRLSAAALGRFIVGAVVPSGKIREGPGGSQQIVPHTPKGGISPKPAKRSCTDICGDASDDYRNPQLLSAIEREVDAVSALPHLQKRPAELRITGGDVERAE